MYYKGRIVEKTIVDKVLSGKASQEEAKSVACWFNNPQGSLELIERIDQDLNQEWEKRNSRSNYHTWKHWLYRVACALLIVIGSFACGYSVYRHYLQPVPVAEQVAYAARGERTQVVLQDGTRIYLNSESQITFPSRFSLKERRVHLNGEAYFEVTKNAHRPFVVEMDQASVTVLGTRFNAISYDNQPVQVVLEEGSVRFSAPNIDDVTLMPGQMVHYDSNLALATVTKTSPQTASTWRNHQIDINNMPLENVIAMLERKYNVDFHVRNPKCYHHSFTLSMSDYSLNEVLRRLDRVSPLSFKYDEKNRTVEVY